MCNTDLITIIENTYVRSINVYIMSIVIYPYYTMYYSIYTYLMYKYY